MLVNINVNLCYVVLVLWPHGHLRPGPEGRGRGAARGPADDLGRRAACLGEDQGSARGQGRHRPVGAP